MTTLTALLALIATALAGVIGAYLKGKSSGKTEARTKQLEVNANVQAEHERIDRAAPDLDASISRLRKRAAADSRTETK